MAEEIYKTHEDELRRGGQTEVVRVRPSRSNGSVSVILGERWRSHNVVIT